ncbi:MAG: hypothetical protein LBM03_00270 [Erysipelotrichaceae bacterium]|jgi:M6 family metalloprotease-like protein|nr:hypothetical protein [Erysipelotrichaceae bacterium]
MKFIKKSFALISLLGLLSACTFVARVNYTSTSDSNDISISEGSDEEISSSSESLSSSESESSSELTSTSEESSSSSSSTSSEYPVGDGYRVAKMGYNYQDYQDHNYYTNMDSMPTTGTVNLLVIPVELKGYPFGSDTVSRIEKAYFGTPEETGWESVASYYHTESKGKLTITGVVSPIYTATYGASITEDQTTNLVTTTAEWYRTNYSTNNMKEFDADQDGYIDGIMLIYSAPYSQESGSNLWAYCYWTSVSANKNSPKANTYFWASYHFLDDDSRIDIDAHTYIHELGHVMGLDDYYNYDNSSSYGAAGGFSMQDYNVGEHDPYSKTALGWIDPIVATGDTQITIAPGDAVILSPDDLSSDSPFDEYLMLDVYSPTGLNYQDATYAYSGNYPKGPSNVGIRVWHVDARLMKNYSGSGTPTLSSTITEGNYYYHAMSNSTNSMYGSMYSGYRSYKLLHLLQQGGTNTYKNGATLSNGDLWVTGDTFSMNSYKSFFVNSGKLDSGLNLAYSFTVNSISGTNVTLTITK